MAPAVDLSVMGLLLATRYLALHGATPGQLRPARRLLIFSSLMTLALNVTDPLLADQAGKAAFDAVGPLLLIGWAEVGSGLLQAISNTRPEQTEPPVQSEAGRHLPNSGTLSSSRRSENHPGDTKMLVEGGAEQGERPVADGGDLLERAHAENVRHLQVHQRPISAETLRKRLRIGADRSRMLVAIVRSQGHFASHADEEESAG